jgi:hypothetical protein
MPRTSSPPRSSVKSFPLHKPSKALPLPAPTPYVPSQSSVQAPGLLDSVKQGFGWGVGTSIARSLFTPSESKSSTPLSQPVQTSKCQEVEHAFNTCIKSAPHDIQTCQEQLDKYNKCLST